jgi:hypothetical protein
MHKNSRQEMIRHAADLDFQNHVFSRLSSFSMAFFDRESATADHQNSDPTVYENSQRKQIQKTGTGTVWTTTEWGLSESKLRK